MRAGAEQAGARAKHFFFIELRFFFYSSFFFLLSLFSFSSVEGVGVLVHSGEYTLFL